MNNIGYLLNYDMREHQINPYGGYNIEFKNNYFRKWLNSGNDFEEYELTYNHYYKIKNERNILATRVKASITAGDVPFQGQNVVGQDDIRGYSAGKYRDNQVYAVQAEYRWRFYKKFGMVGFLGVASAVDTFGDVFDSELLPGAGVGLRYLMIEKERINIGMDIAKGKGDWGLYFRIGESFGR
jgi:hemolysin activation/secretion protein